MSFALAVLALGLLLLPRCGVQSRTPRHGGHPKSRATASRRRGTSPAGVVHVAAPGAARASGADAAAGITPDDLRAPAFVRTLPAELPIVMDLAATGLRAGAAVGPALAAASLAAGDRLGDALRGVAGLLSLGVDPGEAWASLGEIEALRSTVLVASRAGTNGARLADGFAEQAHRLRRDAVVAAERSAVRVGVWSVLPLGLCFLPAFVGVGVIPAVAGLLTQFAA